MTRRMVMAGAAAVWTPLVKLASANERINVGFIGLGGMGMNRLRGFLRHPDVNPVAVCDLDEEHARKAVAYVEQERSAKPDVVRDYRQLLARKDIDAVCIATPDHWHALPMVQAAAAGKDVFVEKPLSYSIGEGRAMVRAARQYKRVTQMGNHIHNDVPNYRRVVELVRSGIIGKVNRVHVWKTGETKGLGAPADAAPPPGFDYDFWLGPAPKRSYNPNRAHFNYRYFWDYSGGMFIDFWCHITDVVYWALDLTAPLSVTALGRRDIQDPEGDNGETPNMLELTYDYPGLTMQWSLSPQGPPGFENWGIGAAFQGPEGTIVTDYSKHKLYRKGVEIAEFERPAPTIADSPGHIREFLDNIKSRQMSTCDVEYGHKLNKAGLLGNLAFRHGANLKWDDVRERVTNHAVADQMVTRKYRKPWKMG